MINGEHPLVSLAPAPALSHPRGAVVEVVPHRPTVPHLFRGCAAKFHTQNKIQNSKTQQVVPFHAAWRWPQSRKKRRAIWSLCSRAILVLVRLAALGLRGFGNCACGFCLVWAQLRGGLAQNISSPSLSQSQAWSFCSPTWH